MDHFNKIEIILGNIVHQDVEAIVNAANTTLLGGGGVDGAIHSAAGPELLEECRTLRGCPTGEARITKGYRLKAKNVIHTVGPVYRDGSSNEATLLACCYQSSLALAQEHGLQSIAFPAISTGVYRYPKQEAAHIALSITLKWLRDQELPAKVTFVQFSQEDLAIYETTYEEITK